ncbi:MAG: response regulator, partial [Deltaproteobacteria bacterium]|nr:response regulator [Deltaproteobacteria bacterium]
IRPFVPWARWLLVLASSILAFLLFVRWGGLRGVLIWLSGLLLTLLIAFAALGQFNLWIPPAAFVFSLSLAYLVAYVFNLERMKRLIQKAKEDWEDSFNAIQDAIVIQDPEGHVVRANKSAQEVFGEPLFKLLKERCLSFRAKGPGPQDIHPDGGESLAGQIVTEETFDPDLNRHLEITSIPRPGKDGQPEGMVQIVRDITQQVESANDKKTLQSQLIRAQKMEAIGTLAGGIAHDFNNILTAMLGFTELAIVDLPKGNPSRTTLHEVLKGGERAKKLIQRILAFSRQRTQEIAPTPVAPVVREAMNLLRSTLPSTIEIQLDLRSEGKILGDPTQIHQVVMNLCTNAYHAMQEQGGVLRVALYDVTVGTQGGPSHLRPGQYMKMSISDTGHGMTPDIQERIFEPYFTTKEKGVGTGLGLSVVHGIVENHNGHIKLWSEPGKGTAFEVLLPTIEAETAGARQDSGPMPKGSERILVVDDERPLVDMEKEMLELLGYAVTTEQNSVQALDKFRKDPHQFDLVITDMTMPHTTGEKLAREIIAIRPEMPIILCTGFSENMNEEKARAVGIREFVMKPLVMRDLAFTIRKVLDKPAP